MIAWRRVLNGMRQEEAWLTLGMGEGDAHEIHGAGLSLEMQDANRREVDEGEARVRDGMAVVGETSKNGRDGRRKIDREDDQQGGELKGSARNV